ncbi:MAG: hypothetical protein A2104_04355 [Candidatus Melainabacteria bacterium GWF2_32_7]|nr:MAG: hypothetical protein A2104_04355 [Candidatus Melainabacteria bacterium GWF2_32_7]
MLDNSLRIHTGNTQGGAVIKPLNNAYSPSTAQQSITNIDGMNFADKPFVYFNFLKMKDPQSKAMYKGLYDSLDQEGKYNLETLLRTGRLLAKNSADGSSTLQNLYKIASEPRVSGLDNREILNETIKTLANPFIITQKFGKIPDFMIASILTDEKRNNLVNSVGLNNNLAPHFNQTKIAGPIAAVNPQDLNVETSGTCVAASMEFNLADKKPAEFARYIASLTSPDLSVKTKVNLSSIDPNPTNAINTLVNFGVEYRPIDQNNVEVTLRPDRNAIIRARVQNTYRQPSSRSAIDALMQSTVMQLGSANGYNSLTDIRAGDHVPDNKGLVEVEKNFAETIIDSGEKKTSITYQIVESDEAGNNYLKGYNNDLQTTQKHLLDSLKSGSNVVVGITQIDQQNKIIGGHEITIIGSKVDQNGELHFIYNDTDDDKEEPIEISAKELIPKVHHAGIPSKVLLKDPGNYNTLNMQQM